MTSPNETAAEYESPTLTTVGSLAELTQAHHKAPTTLDATFPTGTASSLLTWS
jgi:hypothetical protein